MSTEQKLREALEAAQLWHNRSNWRFGTVHQREAWDEHRRVLANALTQPLAPEQQAPQFKAIGSVHIDTLSGIPKIGAYDGGAKLWPVSRAQYSTGYVLVYIASPAAPEAAKPKAVECYSFGGTTGINDYRMTDGSIKAMRPNEVEWAAKPETERAELIQKLQSVPLCSAVPSLEDERVMLMVGSYCKKAAALLSADSKAGGEPLTDSYVQVVPDKCDRIVWRNHYYHLPIYQADTHPQQQAKPLTETEALLKVAEWICQDDQVSLGPKCCNQTVVKLCNGCPHGIGKDQA